MAQLSQDEALLSIDECLNKIQIEITPCVASETVPLLLALNKINAQDIFAPISLPSFYNSAVDGYAVRLEDATQKLTIEARIAAGDTPFEHKFNTATRIFTGAPMPFGADTVFMQEDVRVENNFIYLPQGLKKGANTRPIGEDIQKGTLAFKAGEKINPRSLALLAALGFETVKVAKPLKIGVFSTGNEIISPPTQLVDGKIFDANRFLLLALLRDLNVETQDLGILKDNQTEIEHALQNTQCDLILTSGGVSTGDEDHVKNALSSIGTLDFWRLGIKPGRPVAIGKINSTYFVGLPGNPVAVYVTFNYIVKPILAALRGEAYMPPQKYLVTSAFDYKKKEGRREYVRVTLHNNHAEKYSQDGAGVLTSLTQTDGLLELPEQMTFLKKGEAVSFIPY